MPSEHPPRLPGRLQAAAGGVACLVAVLVASPAGAARGPGPPAVAPKPFVDVRGSAAPGAGAAPAPGPRSPVHTRSAATARARASLGRALGPQAVLAMDPRTDTPRALARLGGTLTGPSGATPAAVARTFAREHATALGLDPGDVDALGTPEQVQAPGGLTTLRFRQSVGGIPAFDNALTVAVDRAGRVVAAGGSPAPDLAASATGPQLGAAAALRAIADSVGARGVPAVATAGGDARRHTRFVNGDMARLVLFDLGTGAPARLAWHATYDAGALGWYDGVVDAVTGKVLHRASLTRRAATARVFPNFPGAPAGGSAVLVDLESAGYLPPEAAVLNGPNVRAYSDVDASDTPSPPEEVSRTGGSFEFPFAPFNGLFAFAGGSRCSPTAVCSWNSSTPTSWTTNRRQATVQQFWLANVFHDHLLDAPIGFDRASGNFQDEDPVVAESDDGAATGTGALAGGPTAPFLNNANMATPPDGQSPRMQMYLGAYDTRPYEDPEDDYSGLFRDGNNSDDAATVFHENAHGLSGRLVTSADGSQALDTAQAGAMGEGWSDFFALDLLVRQGLVSDTAAPGEVDLGEYSDAFPNVVRYEPIDCGVGQTAPPCNGSASAGGAGGFTYGDVGRIASGTAEVHADGEVWGQTLWDLRRAFVADLGSDALGSDLVEGLVTAGMRLTPPQPSMLDARNAIIQADTALHGGAHVDRLWGLFAARGMGFFADTAGSADTSPGEDFSTPPPPDSPRGALAGRVVDQDSGLGVGGGRVGIGGLSTPGFAGALATDAAADGAFAFGGIPARTYPSVLVEPGSGYFDRVLQDVRIDGGLTTHQDVPVRRTWAFGAAVSETLPYGSDYGCGPGKLADAELGSVWEVRPPPAAGPYPAATISLPQPIDVTRYAIDPGEGCGSSAAAALKDYRLQSSTDGTTWTLVAEGAFGPEDRHRLNEIAPAGDGRGVRFVRLTAKSAQDNDNGYLDVAEIAVFGGPRNALPSGTLEASPGAVPAGGTVTFSAATFRDPDSAITGYDWDFDGNGTADQFTAGPSVTRVYASPGTFVARVAARDFRGGAGTASATVTARATGPAATPSAGRPTLRLLRRSVSHRLRVQVGCPVATPCAVRARALLSTLDARRLRLRSRVLSTRSLTRVASRRTVTLAVSAATLRRARSRGRQSLAVSVDVRFTPRGGRPLTKRLSVRVRV